MVKLQSREGFQSTMNFWLKTCKEKVLVASRFMYGNGKSDADHFSELSFTSRLKQNVQAARMQYQLYLEEQRKLHAKRKLLNKSIQAMSLEADKLATETKVKHNFTLLTK